MSPERGRYEDDEEFGEEEPPRSVFTARWFRALLVVIILAVVGVVALPYALEWLGPPSKPPVSAVKPSPPPPAQPPSPPTPAAAPPATPPAPAAPASPAPKVAQIPMPVPPRAVAREAATAASRGDYWVQVGAFSDGANAARLAGQLMDQKYPVQRATVTRPAAGSGNEVIVAGATPLEVLDRVKAKGYRAEAVEGGAVVRPPLPLRDAVELSRELAEAGMEVKIRRAGGGKGTFHVVRVGGFSDRRTADAARKELKEKGVLGFVVKGAAR